MPIFFPAVFERYVLLAHPFFQNWKQGILTKRQLSRYAAVYGALILDFADGWRVADENKVAQQELVHYLLWRNFALSLANDSEYLPIPQVDRLIASVKMNVRNFATALGTLYAFKAIQPAVVYFKLLGLQTHYSHWHADETYFEILQADFMEPILLEEKLSALSPAENFAAARACEETCRLLYDALTGIMGYNVRSV